MTLSSKLKFTSKSITPEKAKDYLDAKITPSRNISNLRVNEYARIMVEGLWKENPQPLVFDANDKLLDGQHRLLAVVRSKTTQPFTLCSGADPEMMAIVDSGRPRSAYDFLTTKGVPNASAIAVVLMHSRNSRLYPSEVWARRKGLDYHTYLWEYERSPDLYQLCVLSGNNFNHSFRHITRTDYGLAIYRIVDTGKHSPYTATDFLTQLTSGTEDGKKLLAKSNPIRVFKEWIIPNSYRYFNRRAARQIVANNLIYTFNAWQAGENWKDKEFKERPLLPTIMPTPPKLP